MPQSPRKILSSARKPGSSGRRRPLFDDGRRHRRLVKEIPVHWAIEAEGCKGEGSLVDVSVSGARLKLDYPFDGPAIFTLYAPSVPMLPSHARLRWFRREAGRGWLCGVIFLEQGLGAQRWREWLADALNAESPDRF